MNPTKNISSLYVYVAMRRDVHSTSTILLQLPLFLYANPILIVCAVGSQMQQPLGVHLPW